MAAAQPISSTSSLASASSSRTRRRHASASAVRRPCLSAFRLPRGGPARAPCILHRRLPLTAGDRHGLPPRVRAPQRGLRCMAQRLCTGSFVGSSSIPSPLADGPHDRLPAGLDRHPLDPDYLRLPLAPVAVERPDERGVAPAQPVGLARARLPALEGLIRDVRPPEALHRRL